MMEKEIYEGEHELGGSNSVCYSYETNVFDFDCDGRALEVWPSIIFPEILHNTWKLKIIKYGTKALNHSKMVVVLNCLALIWSDLGLLGLIIPYLSLACICPFYLPPFCRPQWLHNYICSWNILQLNFPKGSKLLFIHGHQSLLYRVIKTERS